MIQDLLKLIDCFVLSFKNEDDRTSFSKYYVPKVQIKGFNVLIDGKSFFDMPIKNEEKPRNKLLKWEKQWLHDR